MRITEKRIAEIARKTKSVCDKHGYGHQVVVYSDGTYCEATSCNDSVARSFGDGEWEYPLVRLAQPMTSEEVREAIRYWEQEWECLARGV